MKNDVMIDGNGQRDEILKVARMIGYDRGQYQGSRIIAYITLFVWLLCSLIPQSPFSHHLTLFFAIILLMHQVDVTHKRLDAVAKLLGYEYQSNKQNQ